MEQSIPVCPACNSTENRVKFARFSRRFMECGRCGVIFMYPFHEQGETEGAYDRTYYKSWGMDQGDNQLVRRMKMKTAHRLLKTVEKFMPPGRLLDVGCAAGHFLEAAQGKGWDVYGVELSSYAAQLADRKSVV